MSGYKPIHVVWLDAVSEDAWEDIEVAKTTGLATIHTLGFLIEENKDILRVALNLDLTNDSVSQTLVIPKAWIKSRRFIRTKFPNSENKK